MDFSTQIAQYKEWVERAFTQFLPGLDCAPTGLHAAMHYALAAGGKRLRPILLLAAADIWGKASEALPAAVAIECLHTYTLIHDDLPAMDNSPLRRGLAATHIAHGEAAAILAGDALLTEAFAILANAYQTRPALGLSLTADLAVAAGSRQLIGGQFVDTVSEGRVITADELNYIHLNKTAALLQAGLVMGARHGDASAQVLQSLRRIGANIGLAFQIMDDILDVSSSEEQLGKTVNADAANGKNTYVAMHGLGPAQDKVRELNEDALRMCSALPGDSRFLLELINRMGARSH